jgi:hypothetical protein
VLTRDMLFVAWGLGVVWIVGPDEWPFYAFGVLSGILLVVGGARLATDGGRAMAALNERYAPWQRVPAHRFMGGLIVTVGVAWLVAATVVAIN